MKKISLLILLFSFSFLNMGFINKFKKSDEPEIKGIICGSEKFMSYLNKNIDPRKIFRNDHQILNNLYDNYGSFDDWFWYYSIFDIKSGQLYGVYKEDDNLETIQPLFVDEYPSQKTKFVFTSEKKNKNTLIINIDRYENGKLTLSSTEVYNLTELTSSSVEDGKTYTDKCIYYPIPNDVEIINSISR